MKSQLGLIWIFILVGLFAAACAGAPQEPISGETVVETQQVAKEVEVPSSTAASAAEPAEEGESSAPPGTATPAPQPTATLPATALPTALATSDLAVTATSMPQPTTPVPEPRLVELEWPAEMHLGDSDVIRLALLPSEEGYVVQADFPGHDIDSQAIEVPRPGGYQLIAVARLDGVGFDLAPAGAQPGLVAVGEPVTWRWTIAPRQPGQQRLSVSLTLRWDPLTAESGPRLESLVYARALDVQVRSFLGLTRRQALVAGVFGLFFGGGLSLFALVYQPTDEVGHGKKRQETAVIQLETPNAALQLEPGSGIRLNVDETQLLRALFSRYGRLVIEHEFLSGYSGARTFLLQPVRSDGRVDAHTIAKLSDTVEIRQEYENYQDYVKDTLPPITARIQQPPVSLKGASQAALQYTFIGQPGSRPTSLRQALLQDPDPGLLVQLVDTFGPNWWLQRRPYTFRLAQEYDRKLPVHYFIAPAEGQGPILDGQAPPGAQHFETGALVQLIHFPHKTMRPDGSLSLEGQPAPGQPPLRVRWAGKSFTDGTVGRVTATRWNWLEAITADFDRFELPDPLALLPARLEQPLSGTRSTIHGDLNLENILVGPGGFVWLIDFASTREGHPLYDFAHLHAEIIAHVLPSHIQTPGEYLHVLQAGDHALLRTMQNLASRFLFDPASPGEYDLALYMACMGALKYGNLDGMAKHFLYLTAAYLCT